MKPNRRYNGNPSMLTQFLWALSGVNILVLRECYSDHNKYKFFGFSVLCTGVWAGCSSGYAMSFAFATTTKFIVSENLYFHIYVPFLFGLLWGFSILNIDMAILSYPKIKQSNRWWEYVRQFTRIALSIAIGCVIAVPLEMKLCEGDILDELRVSCQKRMAMKEDSIRNKSSIGVMLKNKQNAKDDELIKSENEMSSKKRPGVGPITERYEKHKAEFAHEADSLANLVGEAISNINKSENYKLNTNSFGFSERYGAFVLVKEKNKKLADAMLGITCLFLLFELIPLILKMTSNAGTYDLEMSNLLEMAIEESNNRKGYQKQLLKIFYDKLLEMYKIVYDDIFPKLLEKIRHRGIALVDDWEAHPKKPVKILFQELQSLLSFDGGDTDYNFEEPNPLPLKSDDNLSQSTPKPIPVNETIFQRVARNAKEYIEKRAIEISNTGFAALDSFIVSLCTGSSFSTAIAAAMSLILRHLINQNK